MSNSPFNEGRRYDAPFQERPNDPYAFGAAPQQPAPQNTSPVTEPLLAQNQGPIDPRPKNWPVCKPILHHDIGGEIPKAHRRFVRQGYFGWYVHILCLFYNWLCLFGTVILQATIAEFFYALISLVLGVPASFFLYWLLYSGIRLNSSFRFCIWIVLFVIQVIVEVFFGLGIGYGAAGFLNMLKEFTANTMALGIMYAVSTFLWGGVICYNLWFFIQARLVYKDLGGTQAVTNEVGHLAVQTAVDNKDVIVQVAKDNKETIKQAVVDNKDAIIDFAKENKGLVAEVVVNNKDTIYENRSTVNAIFSDTPKNSSSHV